MTIHQDPNLWLENFLENNEKFCEETNSPRAALFGQPKEDILTGMRTCFVNLVEAIQDDHELAELYFLLCGMIRLIDLTQSKVDISERQGNHYAHLGKFISVGLDKTYKNIKPTTAEIISLMIFTWDMEAVEELIQGIKRDHHSS